MLPLLASKATGPSVLVEPSSKRTVPSYVNAGISRSEKGGRYVDLADFSQGGLAARNSRTNYAEINPSNADLGLLSSTL